MPDVRVSVLCQFAASGRANHRPWSHRAATALTVSLLAVPALDAQVIRGSVVARSTTVPVPGILVVLLDSAGVARSSALTDERGQFVVGAPAAGSYRLRLDAVGFASEQTPAIAIATGEVLQYTAHYDGRARDLPTVTVTAKAACVARHAHAAAVAVLWEEVGKALAVTRLTAESEDHRFAQREFERELDPRSGAVRRTRMWDRHEMTGAPYESIAAESLAAHGYVRSRADGVWYYAPDARTLLSDSFTRTHCLKPASARDASGLVGLAFEPTPGRTVPDIMGVLWLESATSRLRYLEFRYTGLPRSMAGHDLGGRVEFERLASGAWVVREWRIRMPRVSRQSRPMPSLVPGAGPPRLVPTVVEVVTGIIERGGDVTVHTVARGAPEATRRGSLTGVVVDGSSATRLGGAEVWLDAPGNPLPVRRVTADSLGTFRMDSVSSGTYELTVTHPRLEALGTSVAPIAVAVRPGQTVALTVTSPSLRGVMDSICAGPSSPGAAPLRGAVRRSAEGPGVPGATVVVRWTDRSSLSEARTGSASSVATTTDETGHFTLCGTPRGTTLFLRASDARSRGVPDTLTLGAEALGAVTLLAPEQTGEISGLVSTPDGRPLAMAEIALVDADVIVRASAQGRYRIGTLAAGEYILEARAMGYVPERLTVTVGTDATRTVDVRFRVAARVLAPVKTVAPGDRYSTGFHERRARSTGGRFLTNEQIRASGYTRVTDLLRSVPGLQLRKAGNVSMLEFTGRGGRTFSSHGCPVAYAIDGIPVEPAAFGIDGEIALDHVEAIEVYDAATAPVQYARRGTGCGVILIWSRERSVRERSDTTSDGRGP